MRRVPPILVLAFTGLAILAAAGCTKSTAGKADPTSVATGDAAPEPSPELSAYWQGEAQALADLSDRAPDLPAQLKADAGAKCQNVAGDLTGIVTPDDLFRLLEKAPDPAFAQVVSNYEASLSSALAACRGDAPISLDEALAELTEQTAVLERAVDEAGLS